MTIKGQSGNTRGERFVVDIRYQENSTWQGEVLWVDQNRQCSFRSALELLKLIDGALESKDFERKSFGAQKASKGEREWEKK